MQPESSTSRPLWDIFCQVIDNYGDIGVCWRLACDLAARGQQVRLWTDDASALAWMAPDGAMHVSVRPWPTTLPADDLAQTLLAPPQVIVEAFGCYPPETYVSVVARQANAVGKQPVWINLEYLSAEDYVARMHRLPSPISYGPAAGWTRWFFYPGFTPETGGLLRELDLPARQAAFDPEQWRSLHGVANDHTVISLFCYEPPGLAAWWQTMQHAPTARKTTLAITPGRAARAMQAVHHSTDCITTRLLTATSQPGFDEMLWASDLNMVRGEDSLVRALWAGAPLVWHIYPQDDDAHHAKLAAFLNWLNAPVSLQRFHSQWNGTADTSDPGRKSPTDAWPPLSPHLLQEWRECTQAARTRLLAQPSLARQLMTFVAEKG